MNIIIKRTIESLYTLDITTKENTTEIHDSEWKKYRKAMQDFREIQKWLKSLVDCEGKE